MDIQKITLECGYCGSPIPEENVDSYGLLKVTDGVIQIDGKDGLGISAMHCPKCFKITLLKGFFVENNHNSSTLK